MKSIGGYFEIADYEEGVFPHQNGILLNTGRNALEYILRSIGDVKGIYLPYYTCEVVLEPLKKLCIPWTFYHINARFEIDDDINPQKGEYIIANNYYGIKDAYIQQLAEKYGENLIVDCAQALFAKPIPGINTFYSTRKFVGVADGGVAYIDNIQEGRVQINEIECTANHDSHLIKRKQFGAEAGFADYQENETKLDNQPIRWMSETTRKILNHIDYEKVITKRRENYTYLQSRLATENMLSLPAIDTFVCPMIYPFLTRSGGDIRKALIDNKIYVAQYWPNVHFLSNYEFDCKLAEMMIPIPCDQRYNDKDMQKVLNVLFC